MSAGMGRRAIVGSGASLLLLTAAAAGQAKAEELDGELLRLCAEFHKLEAEWRRQMAADEEAVDPPDGYDDVIDAIADLPARTPEGLRSKAAAVIAYYQPDFPDDYPCERLTWSLVHDVAGSAGT